MQQNDVTGREIMVGQRASTTAKLEEPPDSGALRFCAVPGLLRRAYARLDTPRIISVCQNYPAVGDAQC